MYTYIVVIYVHIANKSNIKSKMSLLRCIYLTTADESDDDDELSTGAAVAITFGVTFIITIVVIALISVVITSLYYKCRYELKFKEKVKVDDDKNVNTK